MEITSDKKIIVKHHAIMRYKMRINTESTDNEIRKELLTIIEKGSIKKIKRAYSRNNLNCIFTYNNIDVATYITKTAIIITTCLGDKKWQNWYKSENAKRRKKIKQVM